jgi:hypothetical protein
MTKRKRTYEQVMSMQERAVRCQENFGHDEAVTYLEGLNPIEYAELRKMQIVSEPVQKRRRSQRRKESPVDEIPVGPCVLVSGWPIIE